MVRRIQSCLRSLFLLAALAAPLFAAGCAAQAAYALRVYDSDHQDWHNWDDKEERSYQQYLGQRHEEYRDFSKRSRKQQNDYWKWRHDHSQTARS